MTSLMSQLTASFGASSLSSLSDDEAFDDSFCTSPLASLPLASLHPSHLAHLHQLQQQAHTQHQLQQQLLLQQHRLAPYRAAQLSSLAQPPPFVPYPIIDPLDAWLAMSPYNQTPPPILDYGLSPWTGTLPPITVAPTHIRSQPKRKKSPTAGQRAHTEKKPVEEIDVTSLPPREAIMKAKVRLANLADWKAYTKNNTWTHEVVLGELFVVPINIKFLQLVPHFKYSVSLGFALREDTPGLMSFSEDTLQWRSLENSTSTARCPLNSSLEKGKLEQTLLDVPPSNTIKLNNGQSLTGKELMENPREFVDLTILNKPSDNPNQITLRAYYKYSPCLYLSMISGGENDDRVLFTRKVMIHDIKMIPVDHLHNPMLSAFRSPLSSIEN